jgi:L-2-hydroxyglutarate oxidase
MKHNIYDFAIVGSGIVGVSVAYHLQLANPKAKIILLEKESEAFLHQTSHNSGVIHAGVYYPPDSLKAKFCKEGLKKTYEFSRRHNLRYNKCGKLIVATSPSEQEYLHNLFNNGLINGLPLKLLSKHQVNKIEPNLNATEAILSPETGIIDWKEFANTMLKIFESKGGFVTYNFFVYKIEENDETITLIGHQAQKIRTKKMIACGGLQADRLSRMLGFKPKLKIVPFRGDYYKLKEKFNHLFNHLIYPVPDKNIPFLGIHFTKTIDNLMTVGPNATINFSREKYNRVSFDFIDMFDYLSYKGFWKLLNNNKLYVLNEFLTSLSKSYYLKHCQKYYSGLTTNDLLPYRAGIRAQAILEDGSIMNDFYFEKSKNALFVINAPSPAATSSIPIGEFIANKFIEDS